MRHHESAPLRVLTLIGGLGDCHVTGVPAIQEGVAALLHPAVEIIRSNHVGPGKQRMGGVKQLHRRLLVHYALRRAAQREWQGSGEVAALVLDNQRPSAFDKILHPRLNRGQFGAYGVGADADDDHVPGGKVARCKLRRGEQVRLSAQRFNRLRNQVARAHHVADAQSRRQLHIHLARLQLGWPIEVIWTQSGVAHALPAGLVCAPTGVSDGSNAVRTSLGRVIVNGKDQRL